MYRYPPKARRCFH